MNINTKKCPFCSEEIKFTAIKCKHCRSMLNGSDKPDKFMTDPFHLGDSSGFTGTSVFLHSRQRLGDYEIVRLRGQSGMGMIYETIYHGLDKDVRRAIKTIPAIVSADPRAIKNLKREVRIDQELRQPHIVATYSLEEWQNNYFTVIEHIESKSLSELFEEKREIKRR